MSRVNADLRERAGVEEQVEALADGQLSRRVLSRDGFGATHRARPLAAPRRIVGEISEAHGQPAKPWARK